MEVKLTIFVVCVTVLQNSLTIMSATVSGIQTEAMLDSSILKTYYAVAYLQSEKAVQSTSTAESQVFLPKTCLEDNYAAEQDLYTTKTCRDEIFLPLMASADAVLAAILIVDPEVNVTNARTVSNRFLTNLVVDICSAIELGLGQNSSAALAEIKAIADKQASEAVTFNAAVFAAIRYGRDAYPKIDSTIKSAQGKATSQLVTAIYNVFAGIEILLAFKTQAGCEDIFAVIRTARIQTLLGIKGDLKTKFDFFQALFTASSIFNFGILDNPSTIEDMETSAYPDYNNMVNGNLTTSEEDNPKVVTNHGIKNVTGDCESHAARETAALQIENGVTTIFNTIKEKFDRIPYRKQNPTENDTQNFETLREVASAVRIIAVDAVMHAILIVNPEATLAVEAGMRAAEAKVNQTIDVIYDTINLIRSKNSSKILSEIQAMEDHAIRGFLSIIEDIYDVIVSDLKIRAQLRTAIERCKKESMLEIKKVCHGIFTGIRIRFADVSGSPTDRKTSKLSIKDTQSESSSAMKIVIQNIFDAIESLGQASSGAEPQNVSNLDAVRLDYQIALIESVTAIGIIFNSITADYTKVPPQHENPLEDDLMKSGREAASAARITAVNAVMHAILIVNPQAIYAVQAETDAARARVIETVDVVYDTINLVRGKHSFKIQTKIKNMEDSAIRGFVSLIEDIYAGIVSNLDIRAHLRTTIKHFKKESVSKIKKVCQGIFTGIRIRLADFSGSRAHRKDSISSIEVAQTESVSAMKIVIHSIFDAIESLGQTLGGTEGQTVTNFTAVRTDRETALNGTVNAIDIIFNSIMAINDTKVPPKNENLPEDDLIESYRVETSAAYMAVLDAVFCAIPTSNLADFSAIRNAAGAALQEAVEGIYEAISETQGDDYHEVLTEIQALEVITNGNFSKLLVDIYLTIRKGPSCDAETETTLHRTVEDANSNFVKACQAIFDGIRILVPVIFAKTQTESKDSLSSIEAAYNEASCEFYEFTQNIFDAIDLVLSSCVERQTEIPDAACPATNF